MGEHFFSGYDGALAAERTSKPRQRGITMVVDWGLGLHAQEDLDLSASDYFDLAKVAVGVSRLLSNEYLVSKIERYLSHNVEPFPGGQYLEYAEVHGQTDGYFPACVASGYRWVEVSDNIAPVTVEWKGRMIREAREKHGLSVLGEVGKKEGLDNPIPLVDNAQACVDAGARIVLLEAAELVDGDAETASAVDEIVRVVGLDTVMFELPGPWISGVAQHDIHRMRRDLVDRYGTQVNIGNVMPEDLLSLEAYRRGLGINAGSA
ncbi:phosphosulfolactate synthase [Candidatus Latescibacterota bacterium]